MWLTFSSRLNFWCQPQWQRMFLMMLLLLQFLEYTTPAPMLEEGDTCQVRGKGGVCTLASACDTFKEGIKSGTYKISDKVHCGFGTYEEIICCPNAVDSSSTASAGLNKDFWNNFLTTTTTRKTTPRVKSITTTTAEPDFWSNLFTTTTTTTPKPLVIAGEEINKDAEFLDFSQLLNTPRRKQNVFINEAKNSRVIIPNNAKSWTDNANQVQNNAAWNSNKRNPSSFNTPTRPTQPAEERQISKSNLRQLSNERFPAQSRTIDSSEHLSLNQEGFSEFNIEPVTQFNNPQFTQASKANSLENIVPQNNGNIFITGNGLSIWSTGPVNDQVIRRVNSAESSVSANRVPISEEEVRRNTADIFITGNGLNTWPTGSNIDQTAADTNNIESSTVRSNGRATPLFDPISSVNQNLIDSGMQIVTANLDNVERVWGRQSQPFRFPNERMISSTTIRNVANPFAKFQFRPQPEAWQNNNNAFNPAATNTEQQQRSSPTPTGQPRTTDGNVDSRTTDRPSIEACRRFEENAGAGITYHVLDGTPVDLGVFPHMAAIAYEVTDGGSRYEFRCGATLIESKFVLTAAHCVNSRGEQPIFVRLGAVNFTDPQQVRDAVDVNIKTMHIHPQYNGRLTYNDIAILELERDVEYTENIRPTCLYNDIADPPKSSKLYVTGWGTINTSTRQRSDILLKAQLQIVELSQCNESYVELGLNRRNPNGIINTQMCAVDPGFTKDACSGDSGGPLNLVLDEAKQEYRIIGLISAGFSCGTQTPGLYTRVAAYIDYIEKIVWPSN